MKNISTGFGLCVFGLGIAAWPVLDRLAPSANASAVTAAAAAVSTAATAQTGPTPCRPPVPFLSSTPQFFDGCGTDSAPRIGADKFAIADVNGDGAKEFYALDDYYWSGTRCVVNGAPFVEEPARVIRLSRLHPFREGNTLRLERERVLELDSLAVGQAFLQRYPGTNSMSVEDPSDQGLYAGWADVDGDGDLDLVLQTNNDLQLWFENTGYQRTSRVAADLNADGEVDGADLGLLLIAWGPNP